jgi:hypothetical protein
MSGGCHHFLQSITKTNERSYIGLDFQYPRVRREERPKGGKADGEEEQD